MIVTNSTERDERLRILRNHGQTGKYVSSEPGWNGRLDEMQAAILRVKLRHIAGWQRARQAHAAEYTRHFAQNSGIMPPLVRKATNTFSTSTPFAWKSATNCSVFLSEKKIGSAVYYPVPLHLQPLYASLGHKEGDFPHADTPRRKFCSADVPGVAASSIDARSGGRHESCATSPAYAPK